MDAGERHDHRVKRDADPVVSADGIAPALGARPLAEELQNKPGRRQRHAVDLDLPGLRIVGRPYDRRRAREQPAEDGQQAVCVARGAVELPLGQAVQAKVRVAEAVALETVERAPVLVEHPRARRLHGVASVDELGQCLAVARGDLRERLNPRVHRVVLAATQYRLDGAEVAREVGEDGHQTIPAVILARDVSATWRPVIGTVAAAASSSGSGQ